MKRLILKTAFLPCAALLVALAPAAVLAQEVDPAVLEAERQRVAVVERASAATCAIFANGGAGGGSGVLISPDGYALTNFHVAQPAGAAMKVGLNDGKLYDAVIVGVDPVGDVALIKLLGRDDFPTAKMVDSDQVEVGDWCFAIGNPFLLATDFTPSVSYGIVSGTHRYQYPAGTLLEYADCIQTDAAINPGNSGGPLFDANGDLIGINGRGSFEKRGRVNVGVGYAISINQIKNFMGYLKSGRVVDHATLGAVVSSDNDGKVYVSNILDSSDAWRRGLRYGDEVVSFGGRRIRTVNAFKNVLGIFPRGWQVPMTYRRDGKDFDIVVRLTGVHPEGELWKRAQGSPIQAQPQPQPGEDPLPQGDQPEGDAPEGEKPEGEQPRPIALNSQKPPMPEAVKALYKKRNGFINYYFNEQNQQRVFEAWKQHGTFAADQPWKMLADFDGGWSIKVGIEDASGTAETKDYTAVADFSAALNEQLAPIDSGGMLTTFYLWRRLATKGLDQFGEIHYQGTVPLYGDRDQLVDVLSGTFEGVECRFLFHPGDGTLASVEMYPDDDVDPCVLRLSDYQTFGERKLPQRIEIHHGNNIFAKLTVVQWDMGEGPIKPGQTEPAKEPPAEEPAAEEPK